MKVLRIFPRRTKATPVATVSASVGTPNNNSRIPLRGVRMNIFYWLYDRFQCWHYGICPKHGVARKWYECPFAGTGWEDCPKCIAEDSERYRRKRQSLVRKDGEVSS